MLSTLLAATAGGALFWLLHIPLPWMLGAMIATGVLAWFERAAIPAPARPAGLLVLGLGLGQTFTRPVIEAVAMALPWLILGAIVSILSGIVLARPFARLAGADPKTGYFAAVPGGVVVMAVLAQRAGVSVAAVTLAQTIRVMSVVLLVPPLITWFAPHGGAGLFVTERPAVALPGLAALLVAGLAVALGMRRLNFANPWMLGPCGMVILLSAFGVLPSGVPAWMIDAAQIGMGSSLGQRMTRGFILSSRRLVISSAINTVTLSALLASLAVMLATLAGLPVAAVILGMAPGGMPEMTITAKALEVGVPLVLGFHLVRQVACNLLVGPIWSLAQRFRWFG
jgi:membrane AbrB-like protein